MDTDGLRPDKLVKYRELARRVCARQTTKVIARSMDKTSATIRKWLRDEAFQQILKDMDEQVWRDVMADLQSVAKQSIFAKAEEDALGAYDTLHEIMEDKNASAHVRSHNAETILEIAGIKERRDSDPRGPAPIAPSQMLVLQETFIQVERARNGSNDGKAVEAVDITSDGPDRQPN